MIMKIIFIFILVVSTHYLKTNMLKDISLYLDLDLFLDFDLLLEELEYLLLLRFLDVDLDLFFDFLFLSFLRLLLRLLDREELLLELELLKLF